MISKVLYLGPKGSYSELAKNKFKDFYTSDCEFEAYNSIDMIMRKLCNSNSTNLAGVVPIENSIEGIVRDTQDNLINLAQKGIRITAECFLAIEHSLIGFGSKENIKNLTSHPQALAQCREYIYNNWNEEINLLPTLSTSIAISNLTPKDKATAGIASKYCAKLYNVPIIESGINDKENNTTRFLLLSKFTPKKDTENKVSITFSTENKAGALNKVLSILEKYELNMSYIDSRPSRKELGEYIFYIDFSGHIEDGKVTNALIEIQPYIKMFEILSEGAKFVS